VAVGGMLVAVGGACVAVGGTCVGVGDVYQATTESACPIETVRRTARMARIIR
jgi:riboflavin synthase alpha subunit